MKNQATEVHTNSSSRRSPVAQGGRTLLQKAYEEIKRRIITMEYRPGEYLNEARISKALRAGRTPVH